MIFVFFHSFVEIIDGQFRQNIPGFGFSFPQLQNCNKFFLLLFKATISAAWNESLNMLFPPLISACFRQCSIWICKKYVAVDTLH